MKENAIIRVSPVGTISLSRLCILLFILLSTMGMFTQHSEYDSEPHLGQLAGTWSWPSHSRTILRGFLVPARITEPQHRGLDIALSVGESIHSPAAGTVRFSGFIAFRHVLTIEHGFGLVSSFEPIDTSLRSGDYVSHGQLLGTVSEDPEAQHCLSDCYHFGVRKDDKYINPLLLLGQLPRSVLYPISSPVVG